MAARRGRDVERSGARCTCNCSLRSYSLRSCYPCPAVAFNPPRTLSRVRRGPIVFETTLQMQA